MSCDVLQIVRGSEYSSVFTVTDDQGSAVDLTGASVSAYLRHPFSHLTLLPSLVVSVTDAVNGVCFISMDETQTLLLGLGCVQEMVIVIVSSGGVTDLYIGASLEGR